MDTAPESLKDKYSKILLGFVVGIVITLLVFLAANLFFHSNKTSTSQAEKILNLTLTSPNVNLATSEKTVTVSGNTGIESVVTISCGKQSKIVEANGSYFSTNLDLTEGKNVVTITAFDPNTGNSQQTSREILYLNEDLTNL